MTIHLTEQELYDITHKVRYRAQSKALAQMGIDFKLRPDGSILVSRSCYESSMGGSSTTKKVLAAPDFSSLLNVS